MYPIMQHPPFELPDIKEEVTDGTETDTPARVILFNDEVHTFEVKARNTRDVPAQIEVRRNFESPYWTLAHAGEVDEFEKVDADTVEFTLELPPRSQRTFVYTVTTYQGTRREDWQRLTR